MIIHKHNRRMPWYVKQSESTGRHYVVRGYGPGSLDVIGDYNRKSSAERMAEFLNGTGQTMHKLSRHETQAIAQVRAMDK